MQHGTAALLSATPCTAPTQDRGAHPVPPPVTCVCVTSFQNAFLFNLITAPHPPPLFQALINEADSVTNIAGGYLFMKYQHRAILKASKVLISE